MSRNIFDSETLRAIGSRIRGVREMLKMNQADFGKLVGVGRVAIANYEAGRRVPNRDVLEKIANQGSLSVGWLLSEYNPEHDSDSDIKKISMNMDGFTKELQHEFSKRLREAREHLSMSQAEFASKANISHDTLNSYEMGVLFPPQEIFDNIVAVDPAITSAWLLHGLYGVYLTYKPDIIPSCGSMTGMKFDGVARAEVLLKRDDITRILRRIMEYSAKKQRFEGNAESETSKYIEMILDFPEEINPSIICEATIAKHGVRFSPTFSKKKEDD